MLPTPIIFRGDYHSLESPKPLVKAKVPPSGSVAPLPVASGLFFKKQSNIKTKEVGMRDDTYEKIRYWNLYREAIEAFVKAIEENKNGTVIHSLERLVKIRERDLDEVTR